MSAMEAIAGIGHNRPEPATLKERLELDHSELQEDITSAIGRAGALPATISNDGELSKAVASVREMTAIAGKIETARKAEKEPHLRAGQDVDAFFKELLAPLADMKGRLEKINTAYLRAKADEERRRREEEERLRREEAARKLREAEEAAAANKPVLAEVKLEEAVKADTAAASAGQALMARQSELARTRTQAGTATLQTAWVFQIEDISKVPLDQLRQFIPRAAVEQAIRAFVRIGGRELAGVRIFEDDKAVVR